MFQSLMMFCPILLPSQQNNNCDNIVLGGDFNTHFRRIHSLHTIGLKQFMESESLSIPVNTVDYTYESKITGDKSILDSFSP